MVDSFYMTRISVIKCQVFISNDTMTTARPIDMSLSLVLKQECNDNSLEDVDDDISSVSTMPLPPIPDRNLIAADDPNDEFLRLTTMVRGVYFSYLQKSLLSNYVVCCTSNKKDVTQIDLKTCAGQMELNAVRSSLEASLYRQAMLKMISDIKAHTSRKKVHKKLEAFLNTPPSKVSIAVQTEELPLKRRFHTIDTIENTRLQDCSELLNSDDYTLAKILQANQEQDSLDQRVSGLLNEKEHPEGRSRMGKPLLNTYLKSEDCPIELQKDQKLATVVKSEMDNLDDEARTSQTKNDIHEIFGTGNTSKTVLQENDDSQDSLLQHMEDMFCESDDSSDLMTLIEKHSGVTKANIDLEIGKMCPELSKESKPNAKNLYKDNTGAPSESHANKRKLSFNNYKRMKKQATEGTPQEETLEDRKRRKISKIWFVERVHQVSKLRTRMTEISITNYRKHGRIKAKFLELFGESDDEDMMPDSPICIEEHLTACKERIAPWVVKHLMPFYKKKRISDRTLFKEVAKFIADMLIIENTFPEENDVSKHVQDYFRNKKSIKAKPDIYI